MGEQTAIQWTDHTFNPWIGCTKVHAGCTNCYAEKLGTARLGVKWGDKAERRVTSASNWKLPMRWARAAAKAGERRRVFCASLADVLDERAPVEAQSRLWDVIRETAEIARDDGAKPDQDGLTCGGLDWQILTKRPERWGLVPGDVRKFIWLGTSIADQKTADECLPWLVEARGFGRRFISAEPLVGPVDFNVCAAWHPGEHGLYLEGIDWVIVGGESGPGARSFDIAWARSIRDQCKHAGVACFVKQLGADPFDGDYSPSVVMGPSIGLADKKGGDWSEWPEDLRVREFPSSRLSHGG